MKIVKTHSLFFSRVLVSKQLIFQSYLTSQGPPCEIITTGGPMNLTEGPMKNRNDDSIQKKNMKIVRRESVFEVR